MQYETLKKITITVPEKSIFTIKKIGKTKGYDGHCLRAYSYYPEKMPDIINTVESINSIKKKYPDLRQDSKEPTFALTYQGTWRTLVASGVLPALSKLIESAYHKLYEVADEWVHIRLLEACKTGYVTVAFGLRLRTPILKQTILGNKYTPYEASAEGRTAGNAMGQSYGMLNNRAANEFMDRVYKSKYKYDIKPIAQIHDAQYYLVRKKPEIIKWYNDNLIECMQWQELPELKHDKVKLGAEVMIFSPSWAKELKLVNNASIEQIKEVLL